MSFFSDIFQRLFEIFEKFLNKWNSRLPPCKLLIENTENTTAVETLPTPLPQRGPQARNYVAYIPVPISDDENEDDEYYDEDEDEYDDDDEYYDDDEDEYYYEEEEEETVKRRPPKRNNR